MAADGQPVRLVHALAILAVVVLVRGALLNGRIALVAQCLFMAGSVLFPGALYSLAFGGPRWFGAVAPIGGTAFILGWLGVALAAVMNSDAE